MTTPKTLIVTIPGMIGESDIAPLRQQSDVEYCELNAISEEALAQKCTGYDYLMLNMDVVPMSGHLKLTDRFYTHPGVQSLKAIAVDMTGMDYFSPKLAEAAGILLQNIPHYSSQSVAESILSEILLHSRQRHLSYMDVINGTPVEARKGINLVGRTAGIVGYGSIGSKVAELLAAIGMKVIVWNRSRKENISTASLEQIFQESDVVCIALTTVSEGYDANVGIIGENLLELCHGAIIVNLANELLVDLEAMTQALSDGRVSAYSVEASPQVKAVLSMHNNVHFAPPNAWNSDESMQILREVWISNVISAVEGELRNVYRE